MVTPDVVLVSKNKVISNKGRGKRLKKKSKVLTTPFQGFDTTPAIDKNDEEVYSIKVIKELANREKFYFYTRFQPNVGLTHEFWKGITSGWFENNHIDGWINKLMLDRPEDADRTILPCHFLTTMYLSKTWIDELGTGDTWPFPAVTGLNKVNKLVLFF
ncbi:hypothetical protein R6Q59_029870 [Mikania micrantha]